ncbi:MAG: helix-turn-helix domain-containing protein [bacterium]
MQPIFVRKLSKSEIKELKKLLKSTNTRLYKRARVIWLSSAQQLKAPEIAKIADLHLNKVRKYIRRFNERGIAGLYQKPSPGRPRQITTEQRRQIIRLLKAKPKAFGLPLSSWNLRELCQIAIKEGIVKSISPEYMRRIIAEEGYSYKRSKRWITSPDPEYELKKTLLKKPLGVWTKLKR